MNDKSIELNIGIHTQRVQTFPVFSVRNRIINNEDTLKSSREVMATVLRSSTPVSSEDPLMLLEFDQRSDYIGVPSFQPSLSIKVIHADVAFLLI